MTDPTCPACRTGAGLHVRACRQTYGAAARCHDCPESVGENGVAGYCLACVHVKQAHNPGLYGGRHRRGTP